MDHGEATRGWSSTEDNAPARDSAGRDRGSPAPDPARRTREATRGWSSTEDNAAGRDAGSREDVLGAPYRARTLPLRPDDEGEVVATLVHRPADSGPSDRAVLHVHGFADYFFQTPAAEFWTAAGYDFFALDLRKYGRSLLPHQTPNYVDDLATYHEELDEAWERVRQHHSTVLLSAHSTGGLTVPLWVADRHVDVAAMVLNAPWLDMQGDLLTRRLAIPVIERLASRRPRLVVPRDRSGVYARSLHRDHDGEWPFDLAWKPLESWPVYAGWLRAIRRGQARVARGLDLDVPVLTLCSARSRVAAKRGDADSTRTDLVLDVEQIRRRAPLLSRHVTVAMIEGAVHDVTLSAAPVRARVFEEIGRFLTAYVTDEEVPAGRR